MMFAQAEEPPRRARGDFQPPTSRELLGELRGTLWGVAVTVGLILATTVLPVSLERI